MKTRKPQITFFLILLGAILLRLIIVYTKYHNINSDNGILGLMARHILKGEFPIFFYGQPYMGSLEAFIIAFFFLIFGISTKTMCLAMIFITTIGIISVYLLGKELKDRTLGLYAMLIAGLPPAYIFWHGLAAFGGYPETFLFGNILLILTLRIIKTHLKIRYYILLGFISGLAFWTHLLIIYYLLPIAIFLLINEKKRFLFLKAPLLVIPPFIIGSLPLWIYNIRYRFDTFTFPQSKDFFPGLGYLINTIPQLLCSNPTTWFFYIILSIYFISFIFLIVTRHINQKFIFFLLFISIAYFFSKSPLAHVCCPRYIIPLFTVIVISTTYMVWYLNKKIHYIGLIPLVFILSFNSLEIYKTYLTDKKESYADHKLFTELINFLDKNKLYTNYCVFWISQKLNFLSGEKIINANYEGERYLPYEDIVEASRNIAFIESDTHLEPMFNMICRDYTKSQIGPFFIYYNFRPVKYYGRMIQADLWKANSNYNNNDTIFAFDRNADTYWGTTKPKGKGMYFELDMDRPYKIYKIALFNNGHWRNFPLDITLEVSNDAKHWDEIEVPKNPEPLFLVGPRPYWHLQDGRIELVFSPRRFRYIKISQASEDSQHPWEINEIFVWEYLGEKDFSDSEIMDIYNFLTKKGIDNIYADFFISAKLNKTNIRTLKPINKQYPFRENTSRLIDVDKNTAFIIDNENLEMFNNLGIEVEKEYFDNYTCIYLKNSQSIAEYLYWSGFGPLRTNRMKIQAGFNKREINFKGGFKFLGFNTTISNGTLNIDYFWQLRKFPKDIFAFVHFVKDGRIIFQNDHPLLERFPFGETITGKEIFKESYTLEDIPSGTYSIILGLWVPDKNKRLEIENGKAEVIIGSVRIE